MRQLKVGVTNGGDMKIMAIGAHPDDLEILCGGTLAKYAKEGNEITMCSIAKGDKGDVKMAPEEIASIRAKEAQTVAEIIGAKSIILGIKDSEIFVCKELRELLVESIRQEKPDVIITHSQTDYLADHVNTSKLVEEASFWAAASPFKTKEEKAEPAKVIPPIFYTDTICGINFQPTEYVDITDTFEIKKAMISKHKSQVKHMRECFKLDIMYSAEIVARFRGMQYGVEFAEGFRKYEVWPRLTTKRLLP